MEKNPFPAVPAGLTTAEQTALVTLETRIMARQPRTLVVVEPEQMSPMLTVSVDRLLRFAVQRMLILAGTASLKPEVVRWWETATSPIDGRRFTDLYAAQYALTSPLAPETRVCLSTLREIQLSIHEAKLAQEAFDLVLVYGPLVASHVWQIVLDSFTAPCIGWSDRQDAEVRKLFGWHVVSTSSMQPIRRA
jgi:hypothetical protein